MCVGIGIAAVADSQLHSFVTSNERRQAAGKQPVLLLDTGTVHKFLAYMR